MSIAIISKWSCHFALSSILTVVILFSPFFALSASSCRGLFLPRQWLDLSEETTRAKNKISAEIGEAYSVLAVREPGILSRLDHFLAYARQYLNRNPEATVTHLREAYSNFLGTIKVYRGLALNENELEQILSSGLPLPEGFSTQEAKTGVATIGVKESVDRRVGRSRFDFAILELQKLGIKDPTVIEAQEYLENHKQEIEKMHKAFSLEPKYLASITINSDAAAWVASTRAKNDKRVYVFEINVDQIDTIWGNNFESWIVTSVAPERISLLDNNYYHNAWFDHNDFPALRGPRMTPETLPPIK